MPSNPTTRKPRRVPWHKKKPVGTSNKYQWWYIEKHRFYIVSFENVGFVFEISPIRIGHMNYSVFLGKIDSFSGNTVCVNTGIYASSMYLNDNYVPQIETIFTQLLESDDFEIESPIELVQTLGGSFLHKPTFVYHPKPEIM